MQLGVAVHMLSEGVLGAEEGIRPLRPGVRGVVRPDMALGAELSRLNVQYLFLATRPSLQPSESCLVKTSTHYKGRSSRCSEVFADSHVCCCIRGMMDAQLVSLPCRGDSHIFLLPH